MENLTHLKCSWVTPRHCAVDEGATEHAESLCWWGGEGKEYQLGGELTSGWLISNQGNQQRAWPSSPLGLEESLARAWGKYVGKSIIWAGCRRSRSWSSRDVTAARKQPSWAAWLCNIWPLFIHFTYLPYICGKLINNNFQWKTNEQWIIVQLLQL